MLLSFNQFSSQTDPFVDALTEKAKRLAYLIYEIEFLQTKRSVPCINIKRNLVNDRLFELDIKHPEFTTLINEIIEEEKQRLIEEYYNCSSQSVPCRPAIRS